MNIDNDKNCKHIFKLSILLNLVCQGNSIVRKI